eukprot:TRINITY_DN4369_c0_g2_i1.p1 TRINITY_DN4369_c0_g2~~TRINITY_DN4369_c0_g2_i1.p1  ORF type:complete len:209 (+),score=39.03 TRINITY_DN4369_c0_g2_i1:125-751(+)
MQTEQSITSLIENNRYSADIIKDLENYVQQQVSQNTYHQEANLALLKLYQFYPSSSNTAIISLILLKALMALPTTDFLLCSYLIPEKIQTDESLNLIFTIASHLECAKFKEFWTEATKLPNRIPGFDDAVRVFILGVLLATYQSVKKSYLSQVLNLEQAQLSALLSERGFKQTDTIVHFPPHEEESTKKKISDTYTLEQVSRVLQSIR